MVNKMKSAFLICSVALLAGVPVSLWAQEDAPVPVSQPEPIVRTPLQRLALPDAGHGTVIALAELQPNTGTGRHSHPGPASGYVIYGSLEIRVDGMPPQLVRAGESFLVPANVVHEERSLAAGARVIGVFLVPEGTEVTTPAG
jgi:quercetin dioxygenase-like cupin family protein